MDWRQGSSSVVLALGLAGCGTFVEAESGTDGDGGSSGTTGGTTNATVNVSTSGATDSASGGPGTTPVTSNSDTSGTDPTNASNTDPSETASETGEPTTSSTAGESTTDDSTGTTGSAEGTGETGEETTGPEVCDQADAEPNDTIKTTIDMGTQACSASPNVFAGTLEDVDDLDRFSYFGEWTCGNSNNPNHVLSVTGAVEICWFPICESGSEEVQCLAGTPVTSGDGFAGCCSTEQVVADVNCTFTPDESATGVVLVSSDDKQLVCEDYEVEFSVEDN